MATGGPTTKLNTGAEMPLMAFGTLMENLTPDFERTVGIIQTALDVGYRHLDTARVYNTEKMVGEAVRRSGIPREQVFITTKLWRNAYARNEVVPALKESLTDLGVDSVDLFLIHWPTALKIAESTSSDTPTPTETEKSTSSQEKQPTLASFMNKPYPAQSLRAKSLNKALAEFVVRDMRPVSIIEGGGFRDFVKILDPRYQVVSRNTCLERYIVPMHHLCVAEVKQEIAKSPSHSFTTDAWTNRAMQSFITTTVHCINPDTFELKKYVLDTNHVTESHTGDLLCKEMEEMEKKWGLKNVTGVSDNAANIRSAFMKHDIPFLGCFAHTINLAVCRGLDDPVVKRLTGKVRSLISTFKYSYLRTEDLHQNQKLLDLKELQLVQDVATRWNSVYYMFERLLAVCPAVYASLYNGAHSHLLLTDEDRKNVEDVCKILEPFEKATRVISQDKQPTAGLVLPYLENFLSRKLTENDDDSNLVKKVKRSMKADFLKRYDNEEQRKLLATTSVLDPRVRTLDWMNEREKTKVYKELRELCLGLCPIPEADVSVSPAKRSCVHEIDDDLDGIICVANASANVQGDELLDIIDKEITSYKEEKSFGLRYADSLPWWRKNQHKYPNLVRVMLHYLHIPGSSASSERVFSTAGNIFSRRVHLTPENANMFIFLYHNYEHFKSAVGSVEWDS